MDDPEIKERSESLSYIGPQKGTVLLTIFLNFSKYSQSVSDWEVITFLILVVRTESRDFLTMNKRLLPVTPP